MELSRSAHGGCPPARRIINRQLSPDRAPRPWLNGPWGEFNTSFQHRGSPSARTSIPRLMIASRRFDLTKSGSVGGDQGADRQDPLAAPGRRARHHGTAWVTRTSRTRHTRSVPRSAGVLTAAVMVTPLGDAEPSPGPLVGRSVGCRADLRPHAGTAWSAMASWARSPRHPAAGLADHVAVVQSAITKHVPGERPLDALWGSGLFLHWVAQESTGGGTRSRCVPAQTSPRNRSIEPVGQDRPQQEPRHGAEEET
jgi:hypothetical protein